MDASRSAEDANVSRYRRAAADSLEQLDWCIGYLQGIGRTKVASALSHNRSVIRSQLIRQPAEPLPSERRPDDTSRGAETPPRSKQATGRRSKRTRPRTRIPAGHA
jgi:hypothetical protein